MKINVSLEEAVMIAAMKTILKIYHSDAPVKDKVEAMTKTIEDLDWMVN